MKFIILILLLLINHHAFLYTRSNHDQYTLKINDDYYKRNNISENLNSFKKLVFKEIEHVQIYHPSKGSSSDKLDQVHSKEEFRLTAGIYFAVKRELKFYISRKQDCNVFIN